MSLLSDFMRVDRRRPCPVCGKRDWCLIERENPESPASAICTRVESAHRWGDAGWFHRLRTDTEWRSRPRSSAISWDPSLRASLVERAEAFRNAVDLEQLVVFANRLNLEPWTLLEIGVGWTGTAWSFPMRDTFGGVVGIRLRTEHGSKFAITGSRNGLIGSPRAFRQVDRLYVAEGESDAAALMEVGVIAVGRPGCTSCARLLCDYARQHRPNEIVVVADNDERGRAGALRLATELRPSVLAVAVISPPPGTKDSREWRRQGLTRHELEAAVLDARLVPLALRAAKGA